MWSGYRGRTKVGKGQERSHGGQECLDLDIAAVGVHSNVPKDIFPSQLLELGGGEGGVNLVSYNIRVEKQL